MSHSPKTCLNSTYDNRCLLVGVPDQVAVYHRGIIGSLAHNSTGSKGILFSSLFRYRIMVDHGIHVAGRYEKAKPWLPQN